MVRQTRLVLCREVVVIEPYQHPYRSKKRGDVSNQIVVNLSGLDHPKFKVNKRPVRDRLTCNPGQNYLRQFSPSCPLSYAIISKTMPLRKENPFPNSMLLPTNAQGSGFLLNTQQHCFQGKGEREEPVQLRRLAKCSPSIDRFHCHATKKEIGNRPVEEAKKCYK